MDKTINIIGWKTTTKELTLTLVVFVFFSAISVIACAKILVPYVVSLLIVGILISANQPLTPKKYKVPYYTALGAWYIGILVAPSSF